MSTPEGIAMDAVGNLYVGNVTDATVRVYAPPFLAASAPAVALTVGAVLDLRHRDREVETLPFS